MNLGYIFTGGRTTFKIYKNGSDVANHTTYLADPPSTGYAQVSGSLVNHFNVGDTIKVYISGGTFYGDNHNWFTGFHLGF